MAARTTLNDFQEALELIDRLLKKYASKDEGFKSIWLTQGPATQLLHVQGHEEKLRLAMRAVPIENLNFEDFVSLACRGLMLLQQAQLFFPNHAKEWKENANRE